MTIFRPNTNIKCTLEHKIGSIHFKIGTKGVMESAFRDYCILKANNISTTWKVEEATKCWIMDLDTEMSNLGIKIDKKVSRVGLYMKYSNLLCSDLGRDQLIQEINSYLDEGIMDKVLM